MDEKKIAKYGKAQKTPNAWEISHLKWARELKGMSQPKLADLSGVPLRTIRSYENNQSDINKAQAIVIYKLSSALGVSMETLMNL